MCAVCFYFMRSVRTYRSACPAGRAFFAAKQELGIGLKAFRIVAPRTVHVAPFEKHGGANARPVIHAKTLNIKNKIPHIGLRLRAVGRTLNDLALHNRIQRDKSRGEAADTHEEVLVVFRVHHGVFKVILADDAQVRLHAVVVVKRL